MSYEVPRNPPLPKRWPHWYNLPSLAFHGWVIRRGLTITQARGAYGYAFKDWFSDQQLLLGLSIAIVLVGVISLVRRTRAKEVAMANGIYSLGFIVSLLIHGSIISDNINPDYLFAGCIIITTFLLLLNAGYMVYRYITSIGL
jgi:hypothetical protein